MKRSYRQDFKFRTTEERKLTHIRTFLQILFLLHLAACITPAREKQLTNDIFNLQTRMLQLERLLEEKTGISSKETTKKYASVNAEIERMRLENQRLKGLADALREAVTTGVMPGTDPNQEGTLSYKLNNIITRLETLEKAQADLLESLSKSASSAKPSPEGDKSAGNSSLKNLREHFNKKRFKQALEEAPKVLAKVKTKTSKMEILFIYAESLYKLGSLRDAALKYNEYIELKPGKEKTAHATMRMGDCFRHLGDNATAKLYYEELVAKYPDSAEAKKAKERLDEFKSKGAGVSRSDEQRQFASVL